MNMAKVMFTARPTSNTGMRQRQARPHAGPDLVGDVALVVGRPKSKANRRTERSKKMVFVALARPCAAEFHNSGLS